MSESVKILIEAENAAGPVVAQAAKSVDGLDASLKRIKDSGGQAKKSTDFFKVLASSFGGSEIGGYVSQLGEAAEKTSQFAEVQKLGGAGAFAFRAGLVGLVGTISFGIGNAIGNAIFQTERWKKALEDAKEEAGRLEGKLVSLQATRFAEGKADIELIRDPEAKRVAQEKLFKSTDKEIEGVEKRLQSAKKKVDEYNASYTPSWIQGNNALMEEKYKTDRAALDVLVAQREELRKEVIERELKNEEIKKENALKDKSDDYLKNLREEVELLKATKEEQAGILALRNAIGEEAQAEAKRLLLEKEAIAVAAEAAKEKEAADKKAIADQDARIAGSANYVRSLKEQLDIMRATDADKAGVTAQQKAIGGDVETATNILKEMEAIKATEDAKKKAEDIQKKADSDKEAAALKLVQLKESELTKLEQERILLTQGAEAAKAFALQKQGLSQADAKSIAKQEAELDAIKKRQELLKSGKDEKPEFDEIKGAGPVVASESRLLKRGSIEDPGVMVAKNTTKMIEQNEALRAEIITMQEELRALKENAGAELELAQ
jgi:hypothetical protein